MGEREQRRASRRSAVGKAYPVVDLGNGVEQASPAAVLAALSGISPDLLWDEVRSTLLPMLPRRRPLPASAGTPLRVMLPPGIPTGFGIDIGPANLVVGEDLAKGWEASSDAIVAQALDNLRTRLATVGPADLVTERIYSVSVRILQTGVGCASAIVLLPGETIRVFGPSPALLLMPMRDIVVALPPDVPVDFAAWLNDEMAGLDPNGLALGAVRLDARGTLTCRGLAN